MMKIEISESLNELFDQVDPELVERVLGSYPGLGSVVYGTKVDFDNVDEFAVVDEFVDGIAIGLRMAGDLVKMQKWCPDAKIYRFQYDLYGEFDGSLFLIGSEQAIQQFLNYAISRIPRDQDDSDQWEECDEDQ